MIPAKMRTLSIKSKLIFVQYLQKLPWSTALSDQHTQGISIHNELRSLARPIDLITFCGDHSFKGAILWLVQKKKKLDDLILVHSKNTGFLMRHSLQWLSTTAAVVKSLFHLFLRQCNPLIFGSLTVCFGFSLRSLISPDKTVRSSLLEVLIILFDPFQCYSGHDEIIN